MLDEFFEMHKEVINNTPQTFKRYLFEDIRWDAQSICITGDRGVGKTTLICQDLLNRYPDAGQALYISADHVSVIAKGLVSIAKTFFSYGGKALYIDEVHKYPNWSIEIKNILDTYKGRQVIFSASNSIDLHRGKGDLSRRVVYHNLLGLSFREYLKLTQDIHLERTTLQELVIQHMSLAFKLDSQPILKYFHDYLKHGYYPFFTEGKEDYLSKLNNVLEKVLTEDLAVLYNLKQTTIPVMKKILWLISTSSGWTPNIERLSSNLGVSRELIYNCLNYLKNAGLLNDVNIASKGNAMVRKPGKMYLNNSNLLYAINGSLKSESDIGAIRETFFISQVKSNHKISLHDTADFVVDDTYIFEVGGRSKGEKQIRNLKDAYLVMDEITIGHGNRIPLFLFGLLY